MSRVKRSGSKIELAFGKALWASGIRYRKQYKRLPGCPDFVVVWAKLAIFCDSLFFHGRRWPAAATAIKSNRAFWVGKIEGNIACVADVNMQLERLDLQVVRFWDTQILSSPELCVLRVAALLTERENLANDDENGCNRFFLRGWWNDQWPDTGWISRACWYR